MAMTNPSVTELLQYAECRYTLVVKTAKRARQLVGGAPTLIDTREIKPVSIAVDEISRGLIDHDIPLDTDE
ncbi:MAG: DNA-directed RNA polymerase subunit omega [Oscillospiraceae bacterium]|jgi:DNA-directed RNA polymerase subunit omega|nr:DNA-directed RNA polymerase subunit omega [Oscillospiraceae bacterium]